MASQTLCGTRAKRVCQNIFCGVLGPHGTYLICNEIEEEKRHPKIIRKEGDSRAGLTNGAHGNVEFACQNKDDDGQPEPMRPRCQRRFKRQGLGTYPLSFESGAESNLRDEDCSPVDEASYADLVKLVSMIEVFFSFFFFSHL